MPSFTKSFNFGPKVWLVPVDCTKLFTLLQSFYFFFPLEPLSNTKFLQRYSNFWAAVVIRRHRGVPTGKYDDFLDIYERLWRRDI